MAITFPTVNGNWSNPAIWSGSTLPTVNDDIFANNKTVIIDQNVNVVSIRTTASGSASQGGQFRISGSYTITCAGPNSGIYGGTSGTPGFVVFNNVPNTVTINSNIYHGGGNFAVNVNITGSGNVNIVGNIDYASAGDLGNAILIQNNGTVNIVGNVLSSVGSNSSAIQITSPGSGSVNITGDLVNRSTNQQIYCVTLSGAISSSLSITGNITPIANGPNQVVYSNTAGTKLVIVGNINNASPSNTTAPVQLISTSQSIDLTGNVFASLSAPGVTVANSTSTMILRGVNLVNSFQTPGNSVAAILSPSMTIVPSNQFRWTLYNEPSSSLTSTMFIQGYTPDSPNQSDVRFGTTYLAGALSGSLHMPQPSQVISGVKTDNTTGSYNVTLDSLTEAIWTKLTSDLTGSNTIGERLKNNSTIDSTGQQLQALN
jgi:hypothetical protein